MEYWWAIHSCGGQVKLHVDKGFLLKTGGLEVRAHYGIHRSPAQIAIGILQYLGVESVAILGVENSVDDHGLE
jgi:hypothetical protein